METSKQIHEAKAKSVKNLADRINNSRTLMIVSIKGLPSKQFQEIKKSIREHALVRVAKKNIMLRAIKAVGKESIMPLEKHIQENCAFAISDLEGYELAGILSRKKTPVFAKAGQVVTEDIEVKEGPTDLVPGPAISELGSLGLQVSVEDGKIAIKKSKIVLKEGQTINETAASILQKLHIQPFSVGLEPIAIYDVQNEKIYTYIKVDSEETIKQLQTAAGKALGFAQKIIYYCKETIGYLLAKANSEAKVLKKFDDKKEETGDIGNSTQDKIEEKREEDKSEEESKDNKPKEEVKEEKPEENKEQDNAKLNPSEDNK